ADGNRALGDDQLGAVHVPADGARHVEHVLQVGRAVLARWRADRDEDDVRALDRGADLGGELQAAVPLIAHDERLESGLVDWESVLTETLDLRGVHIHTGDIVAGLGQTRSRDETDVPRADDGDLQGARLRCRAISRAFRVSTTRRAPRRCNNRITSSAGLSRISSMSFLYATPTTSTLLSRAACP